MTSNKANDYLEVFKKAFTEFNFSKIVNKYKEIFFNYKTFWQTTKADNSSIKSIYQDYLIVLSLISPVAAFLAIVVFTPTGANISIPNLLLKCIISYFIYLAYFYCFALIMENLVTMFNGSCSKENAFKLISYTMFPMFLGGFFILLQSFLPILILLAATIYLLWLGVPVMINLPEEKRMQAFITTTAVGVMLMIVFNFIV